MHEKVEKSRTVCLVTSEGRHVGSLKRRVRSHMGRWEINNCTLLRREAHSGVNTLRTPWETPQCRSTVGCWMMLSCPKVHAVVARSTLGSQNAKSTTCLDHFWTCQASFCVAGAMDSAPSQKWLKRCGFVAFSKTIAGVGRLKRICNDACRVAGAVQKTQQSDMLGGQGADFLREVHFGLSDLHICWDDFAWQVQHFVWPGCTFSCQAQYLR